MMMMMMMVVVVVSFLAWFVPQISRLLKWCITSQSMIRIINLTKQRGTTQAFLARGIILL